MPDESPTNPKPTPSYKIDMSQTLRVLAQSYAQQQEEIAASFKAIGDVASRHLATTLEQSQARIAALMPVLPALNLPALDLPQLRIPAELIEAITEALRESNPPNWPADVDLDQVTTVIQDEGLPLVWVPSLEVVEEILAAPDREARVAILLSHEADLLADCRRVLADVTAERMAAQLPLVPATLAALETGHHQAAQALAVVITDAVISDWIKGKYEAVAAQVHFDPEEVGYHLVRLQAAVAPLASFKTRYFASTGEDRPEALNRQVTVHYADAEHFTRGNALVACLLMTSVMRALQEFEERYGDDE